MSIFALKTDAVTTEPITKAEAKSYMRVDVTTDDDLIEEMITAARIYIEKLTGVVLTKDEVNEYRDKFPGSDDMILQYDGELKAGTNPVVSYIKDGDTTYTDLTLDTDYRLAQFNGQTRLQPMTTWPTNVSYFDNAVKIKYNAEPYHGETTAPMPLKMAMYMLIAHMYEERSVIIYSEHKVMPYGFDALINQYRNYVWTKEDNSGNRLQS
tara:strand:- start:705 stop:1334 length:630 start_codon:yes stop_codon:yes gene_type:complete